MKHFVLHGAMVLLLCMVSNISFAQQTSVKDSTSSFRSSDPFASVEAEEITMYPNPSDGVVQVSLRESINESIIIKVYNRSGEEVYKHHVHFLDGKTEINVKHLLPGIYILHVETGDKTYTHYFSKL
jgi:hypothetical protein